ncbi:MAG: DnaT-like ssDNA-binding protein [Betaproteobacteria bacterium]
MVDMVVEDGTGLSNANSYVTLQEAEDYLSIKSASAFEIWDAELDQENYLMQATRVLDQRAHFTGYKTVSTSALRWPRSGVSDRDGVSLSYDVIPNPIKAATIEIAYHLLSQNIDPSLPTQTSDGQISSIKADVIEIKYVSGTAGPVNHFPLGINSILQGLGSIATGVGSKFGRILRA